MLKKKKTPNREMNARAEKGCSFCKEKSIPRWEDHEKLREYLSSRGRVLPGTMTGVCVKHQRVMARAIKQARHLALLPFTVTE